MAARNPVAGASSSYMHNYPMQGRYMPPHHNVMVSALSLFHVYSAFVHDEISFFTSFFSNSLHTAQVFGMVSAPLTPASRRVESNMAE